MGAVLEGKQADIGGKSELEPVRNDSRAGRCKFQLDFAGLMFSRWAVSS